MLCLSPLVWNIHWLHTGPLLVDIPIFISFLPCGQSLGLFAPSSFDLSSTPSSQHSAESSNIRCISKSSHLFSRCTFCEASLVDWLVGRWLVFCVCFFLVLLSQSFLLEIPFRRVVVLSFCSSSKGGLCHTEPVPLLTGRYSLLDGWPLYPCPPCPRIQVSIFVV